MNKNLTIIGAILALAVTNIQAESAFDAKEFNLSFYGTGSVAQKNGSKATKPDKETRAPSASTSYSKTDVDLGLGIAGDYFITKGLGIGARAESENAGHSFFDRTLGRVTLRAPLWDAIAPYGYCEGGFQFEDNRWLAGAGGGVELRLFNKSWGAFAEAGLETTTRTEASGRGAVGVRLKF